MAEDLKINKQGKLIGVNITLVVLSAIFVALRLLARRIARAGLWYDDYAIIFALISAWLTAVMNLVAAHFEFGKHPAAVRPDIAWKWNLCIYIIEIVYTPAIAAVKFSILLFYARIFPSQNRWFRWALYAMAGIVLLWWIICQFISIFQCTPINHFWDEEQVTGHCIHIERFLQGQAIPNIITDIILLALPMPLIWKLHLPQGQKLALCGVFLLGSFVTATSIYRLALLIRLSPVETNDYETLWVHYETAIWSAVEPNSAVISACLPMLRPLVKLIRPLMTSAHKRKTFNSTSGFRTDNSQQAWRTSMEPIVSPGVGNGHAFTNLADRPSESDIREGWELQHSVGKVERANFVGRGDSEIARDAELGRIPQNVIHVKNELSSVDHRKR